MTKQTDMILVKVALRTTSDPNDSDIKEEWHSILREWAGKNGCVIHRIEWTRLRKRFVSNPKLSYDETFWDKVEERL